MPTDREEATAWQRQYGQGSERDSLSCLGMVSMNREWGLLGRDKPEQEQRKVSVLFKLNEHDQELEYN